MSIASLITTQGGHKNWWCASLDPSKNLPVLSIDFNATNIQHMTYQAAADYSALLMATRYENLWLAMSGGLDSEFIAEVLYRNSIPFTPVIATCPSSQNFDYFAAMHWCQSHNLDWVEIKFELDDPRLIGNLVKMIKVYRSWAPGAAINMSIADYVEGQGGQMLTGDPQLVDWQWGDFTGDYWQASGDMFDVRWLELLVNFRQSERHPGAFYFYTPELVSAYIREFDTTVNANVAKNRLYKVVPYKVKTYPFEAVSTGTLDKLQKMYNWQEIQSHRPTVSWHKQELYNLLHKLQND